MTDADLIHPRNGLVCDKIRKSVTDNFRIISPKDFRVLV
jgi:hypothetical protein